MIKIKIDDYELYNESINQFVLVKGATYTFEHSLISLTKWEEKYKKPFLDSKLEGEELEYYCKCMCIGVLEDKHITPQLIQILVDYIYTNNSATFFTDFSKNQNGYKSNSEVVTSEVIYSYMVMAQIPFQCEKWNLNRLMNLLRIISIKNNPESSKMSVVDGYRFQEELNEQRKKKYGTRG